MPSKSPSKQSDSAEALILMLAGGLAGAGMMQNTIQQSQAANAQLIKQNLMLTDYYKKWSQTTVQLENRRNKLTEYDLVSVIRNLTGETKEVFVEAINCYLFGRDLASANMVCLAIEQLLREAMSDTQSKLVEVIDSAVKKFDLSPELQHRIHILRKQRNVQSHSVSKLNEISLLGLFAAVKDLHLAFTEVINA